MHVTIVNPDAPLDSPAYDGEADQAHTVLAPGGYETTTQDIALLVSETASIAVMVDRVVTIFNDDDPTAENWTGLASQVHLDSTVGYGTYSARYVGNDGQDHWGNLEVMPGRSYLEL